MSPTLVSLAAEVTLRARLRGQFAALRFASPPETDDEALLLLADPGPESRVVVTAPDALELTCTLLRRGLRAVTMARRYERVPSGAADIVIIPRLAGGDAMASTIAAARRMLAPLGSLVLRVASEGPQPCVGSVTPLLREQGFSRIRTRMGAETALIRADLPVFGRLPCL